MFLRLSLLLLLVMLLGSTRPAPHNYPHPPGYPVIVKRGFLGRPAPSPSPEHVRSLNYTAGLDPNPFLNNRGPAGHTPRRSFGRGGMVAEWVEIWVVLVWVLACR